MTEHVAKRSVDVLDLDSTEDPTHGQQPFAFFNAVPWEVFTR